MSNPTEPWGEATLVGGEPIGTELATGPTQAWDEATLAGADETLAGGEPLNQRTRPSHDRRPVERGAAIGRYLILSTLGAGGMGVVYAAYDPELDRKVAVKLLRADGGSGTSASEGRTRLLREAQALAKLAHPNVVAIHDVGTHGDEVFLAMEFVDGQPLGDWAKAKPRTWREKLSAVVEAGRGVAAAHAAGLLHRDLKPDNIMVAADGRARVMDLGLARAQAKVDAAEVGQGLADTKASPELAALAVRVTQAGAIMGTPAYMAPEQFRGAEVGTGADQFALCVTAWELLAGSRPFTGETLMELAANVLTGKRSTAPHGTDVPRWVWSILERGLAAEPAQRWPSIEALLIALERGHTRARSRRMLAGVTAVGIAAAGVVGWREVDERQRIAACEAEGASIEQTWNDAKKTELREALLATGVSYAAVTADKVTPWFDAQAQAWAQARTDACRAATVERSWDADTLDRATWCLDERQMELAALIDELRRADAQAVQAAVTAAAKLSPIGPCVDPVALSQLPAPPSARAEIQSARAELSRAGALEAAGRYEAGLEVAEAALAQAEVAGWPPLHAAAQLRVGRLLDELGRYPDAEAALERAYFEAGRVGATGVAADAAIGLVRVVGFHQAHFAEGEAWDRHAAMMLDLLGEPDGSLRRAESLTNLAVVQDASGADAAAEATHGRVLAIREQTLGPDHPQVAESLAYLASLHAFAAEYDEAKALQRRALTIREAALGLEHPDVASSLTSLANIHLSTGAHLEARELQERALAIREKALGPNHPDVATSLANLSNVFAAAGDHARAKALSERALAIREETLGSDHPGVASALTNLAATHQDMGSYAEAKALHERALAIWEKAQGPDHPNVGVALNNLGSVASAMGADAEARVFYERALVVWEKALGPDHPRVATVVFNIASIHQTAGAYPEAKAMYGRALTVWDAALGPDHPKLAHPMIALAEIALVEGRPGDATPLAERALTLRVASEAPADELAEARFVLARALWDAPVDAGRDRARAIELATQACDAWRDAGGGSEESLAEAERWLLEHGVHP